MNPGKPIVVFVGPSLGHDEAREILDADYYPPASMGDIYSVMSFGVGTIILIDGLFHGVPSVWHREILDALSESITVLGASSMGALRAAELHPFGMVGHGTIFEWYRDGIIDGDDEVALRHGSQEEGFCHFSEPLVNIRYTLARAVEDHCLMADQAHEMITYAKQLYYPERSYQRLLDSPIVQNWPVDERAALEQYLETRRIDLKRRDAISVLRCCSQLVAATQPVDSDGLRRPMNMKWELAPALRSRFVVSPGVTTGDQVLREAQKDAALTSALWVRLSQRYFVLQWAKQTGVSCPSDYSQAFAEQWAQEHDMDDEGDWFRANGLLTGTHRRLLGERALEDWIVRQGPAAFGIQCGLPQDRPEQRAQCFVLAWAQQNGVSGPAGRPGGAGHGERAELEPHPAPHALVEWVVQQGPVHFGMPWSFEVAMLRELQITGRAAEFADRVAAA
jgi:hypothetical protein